MSCFATPKSSHQKRKEHCIAGNLQEVKVPDRTRQFNGRHSIRWQNSILRVEAVAVVLRAECNSSEARSFSRDAPWLTRGFVHHLVAAPTRSAVLHVVPKALAGLQAFVQDDGALAAAVRV